MLRAIARQLGAAGAAAAPGGLDEEAVAPPSPWHSVPLFVEGAGAGLSASELEQLQLDGHVVLPGVLNEETIARTIEALARIDVLEAEHAASPEGQRKAELQAMLQQPGLDDATREACTVELNTWGPGGTHGLRMGIGQVVGEHDEFLESIIGHPEMLALAKSVLGDALRFDHQCTSSRRQPGDQGMGYHSHDCALQLSSALQACFSSLCSSRHTLRQSCS